MANGLAFCSHVQEMRTKGPTAASFVHQLFTTMLRLFRRSLSEKFVNDYQSHTRWSPSGTQVPKDPQ